MKTTNELLWGKFEATHTTKKGFGGLLAADIECRIIVKQPAGRCFIQLKGRGNLDGVLPTFFGNLKDLTPINTI